jgi:hypothetical protein
MFRHIDNTNIQVFFKNKNFLRKKNENNLKKSAHRVDAHQNKNNECPE